MNWPSYFELWSRVLQPHCKSLNRSCRKCWCWELLHIQPQSVFEQACSWLEWIRAYLNIWAILTLPLLNSLLRNSVKLLESLIKLSFLAVHNLLTNPLWMTRLNAVLHKRDTPLLGKATEVNDCGELVWFVSMYVYVAILDFSWNTGEGICIC